MKATAGFLAAGAALLFSVPAHADRLALWTIVHEQCVPHLQQGGAPPKPCDAVDMASGEDKGVAELKDRNGVAQMLAIPTHRVTGIEDPFLLSADAPNYFASAWTQGRALFETHLGAQPPRDAVAITVNSMFARSQDQLHLHVDCLDKAVAAALRDYAPSVDETWRPMTVALHGRNYWARRLVGETISASPFLLLAEGVPVAKTEMGLWTVAAVGANFAGGPGFVLLADHAGLTEGGHAEDIQDHDCAIARP
jgi:CDP-diacylglycerol pyrophosphatase